MRVNILKSKGITTLPDGWHTDGNGLYLNVRNGTRTWVVRTTVNRQRLSTTLGNFPEVSLGDARSRINDAKARLKDVAYGLVSSKGYTFEEVALEALEQIAKVKQWTNVKHKQQWFSTINAYVLPYLGKRLIASITVKDIKTVLDHIWYTKTETAKRLRGRLKQVFAFAILMGYYKRGNPAEWEGCLDQLLPSPDKIKQTKHHDAAPIGDIPAIIKQLYTMTPRKDVYLAIIFGTLTATRAQEFTRAKWDEFDFEKDIWTIPPERVKSKEKDTPIRVPLTPQMKHILLLLQRKNKEFVFEAPYKSGQLSPDSPLLALRDLGHEFTMHGMRSTFSDWATEAGENPVYIEKALNHALGNKVQRAYQRSDCLEQRRPLMERWNKYCFGLA